MDQILPVVMNSQFERLAVIDDYNSFIWVTRYYKCGDFELCVDVNEKNIALFNKDYFIIRDDDENVGLVEKIEIQKNEDNHELLIVSGRFLPSIIGRRIISQQTIVNGKVSDCVDTLLTNEIINPTVSARQIPNFVLGTYSTDQKMKAQYTGANLLDKICEICQAHGLGFKVTLNDENQFVFQLIEGTDHSYNQDVNTYIVFSDEYDNLLSSQYEENYQNIATDVLVAGEGEGLDRKTLWVNDGANMISNDSSDWESGGIGSGQNTNTEAALQYRIRLKTGVSVEPSTTYIVNKTAGTAIGIQQMTEEGGTYLYDSTWQTGTSYSFTTLSNCTFVRICFRYDPQADIEPSDIGTNIYISMTEAETGLDRYEVYKDQRNLRTNDGEVAEAVYEEQMQEAGKESLTTITTAFTGTVYFGNVEWKEDVNIGDICVIENKRWGIYINSRLVEVIESVSETGEYSIMPTFGI